MKKIIDKILIDYANLESRKRKAGRYWSSELESIRGGWLKPKDFFKPRRIDLNGARNIITGKASEMAFKTLLEGLRIRFVYEPKQVLEIEQDITLVVKPDFEFSNFVLETKHPVHKLSGIPERYKLQLEAEYQAFKKDIYLGEFRTPFDLRTYKYRPSEKRWEEIKTMLKNFHKEISKV